MTEYDRIRDIPVLDDRTDYNTWKKKVSIWILGTNAKEEQRASKLIMNMRGKPQEVSINIPTETLGAKDGVVKLLAELDKLYQKDTTQSLFKAIDSFEGYRRDPSDDIDEYVLEFQRRHKKLKQLREDKDLYDDSILAYRLLNQANLNEEQARLVRATCNSGLTYDKMQEQLKRTFRDSLGEKKTTKPLPFKPVIKEEPKQTEESDQVYWSRDYSDNRGFQHRPAERNPYWNSYHPDRGYRHNNNRYNPYASKNSQRPHQQRGDQRPYQQRGNEESRNSPKNSPRKSPKRRSPKKRTCFLCDAPDHYCAACPLVLSNKTQQTQGETNNRKVYFQTLQTLSDVQSLPRECVDEALLDTGSSHTICGETWLKEFQSSLQPEDRESITSEVCDLTFCFGDRDVATAKTKVSIPMVICDNKTIVDVYVVDRNIPLLLAFDTMKKLGMVIDLYNSEITIKGNCRHLTLTETGHGVIFISNNTGPIEMISIGPIDMIHLGRKGISLLAKTIKDGVTRKFVTRKSYSSTLGQDRQSPLYR